MINTPWGTSQSVNKITRGVVSVSTAGHGGLGVSKVFARKVLSDAALLCAHYYNGYYWFEEDCQCCVALLEHPEWAGAQSDASCASYKAYVERSYPQYYEHLASNKKAPREPVVGQSLKVRCSFGGLMTDEILKVVEVRAASVIVTRPGHNNHLRIPMSYILGTGWASSKYLELVE